MTKKPWVTTKLCNSFIRMFVSFCEQTRENCVAIDVMERITVLDLFLGGETKS